MNIELHYTLWQFLLGWAAVVAVAVWIGVLIGTERERRRIDTIFPLWRKRP